MADTKQAKLKDLEFDNKNFNKHTEFGMSLLEKSLRNNGAGRSILIDKNNRIIGGNGVVEVAGQIGLENVRIVESDGTEIIAVKRTDIDLDSKQGREMALADNATASADLAWDYEALADIESDYDIELNDWGVFLPTDINPDEYFDEVENLEPNTKNKIVVQVNQEEQMQEIRDLLATTLKDYNVKII